MNELVIDGPLSSALTHMAGVGLASILTAHDGQPTRFWWEDGESTRLRLACVHEPERIGAIVQAHAAALNEPDSWVQASIPNGKREGTAVFSPRITPASPDEWAGFLRLRDERMPQAESRLDALSLRLMGALGQPAWWAQEQKRSPDEGASRWEMKTRNRGEEFVRHRLRRLAESVAARSPQDVVDGLTGVRCRDEVARDSVDSRTATGLRTPGPTDNAMAWCALWGLSALPLVPRLSSVAESAGVWPRTRTHPQRAVLPVFTLPVSPARFRSVVGSRLFDRVAFPRANDGSSVPVDAAREELRGQGVRALACFPVRTGGSASAPERQLLAGEVDVL